MSAAIAVGAISFTLIKLVLREASPLTLATGRVAFSALAFVAVVTMQPGRRNPIASADRWRLLAVGLGGSVGFHGLFAWGQQHVSVPAGRWCWP
jgi:drug/metabolite transporter, DME family